jgi:hypothetical protein
MLEQVKNGLRQLTEMGVLLIALGIVLQILFGATVPFIGGDIVGNLTGLIAMLGENGLVGLIALTIILYLFQKPR